MIQDNAKRNDAMTESPRPSGGGMPADVLRQWRTDRGDQTHRLDYDLDEQSVVFDVGGYQGQWAAEISDRYHCQVLVFEPVRQYANGIFDRFGHHSNIRVYPFGLGAATRRESIGICQDGSSIFRSGCGQEPIQIVDIAQWFDAHDIRQVHVMKINIEGGEYELLERLIDTGLITRIRDIQVQFHDLLPDSSERMTRIQQRLSATHAPTYQYRFVWENWSKKPVLSEPNDDTRIVQFTQLGKFGRFGNQIFQYLYARMYAEQTGSILEIPDWVGSKIFKNLNHPTPSRVLPRLGLDEPPNGRVNVDLFGYFQSQYFADQFDREQILSWLQFKDEWVERYRHRVYDVVAHIRRGDYASKYSHVYCLVSPKSYLDACAAFGLNADALHWVSEESQTVDPDLPEELAFLPDFFTLINAKHLLRANSTFSFWAGFFNKNNVYSPVVADKVGLQDVPFVEGNAEKPVSNVGYFHFSDSHRPTAGHPAAHPGGIPTQPCTSVIILNANGLGHLKPCLESIRRCTPESHEIIVVDNGSTDGSRQYFRSLADVRLIENPVNIGCPRARAQAMALAQGDYVVFLDNDTVVTEGWLTRFIDYAQRDKTIGLIGPRSNHVSGLQVVGDAQYRTLTEMEAFAERFGAAHRGQVTPVHRLIGFCLFMTRSVIDKIGSIDAEFGQFGYEDDDYTWRAIIAGFKAIIAHDVYVHHTGGPDRQGDRQYKQWLADAWDTMKLKWNLPDALGHRQPFDVRPILTQPYDRQRHYVPLQDRASVERLLYRANRVTAPGGDGPSVSVAGATTVSIVIAAYNAVDYIREALESVLRQDYRSLEVVVVNDGSTDDTERMVNRCTDSRIRCFTQSNAGPSAARNHGIRQAQGDYVVVLDSDDSLTPDFVSRHLAAFERTPQADLIYCDDALIDTAGNPLRTIVRREYNDRKALIRDLFACGYPVIPFRTCVRKSVFDKIGYYDESLRIGEDYDLVRRFVRHGLTAVHLPGALYRRRMTEDSLSRTRTPDKARMHFSVMERFAETFDYRELFCDIDWQAILPEQHQAYAELLIAKVFMGVGQEYLKAGSSCFAETAFACAAGHLEQCRAAGANDSIVLLLLEKCRHFEQRLAAAAV